MISFELQVIQDRRLCRYFLPQEPEEWKSSIQPEWTAAKNQEKATTKQLATRKIQANDLHTNILNPREDMMHAITKHLHHSVNRTLEVYEDCAMEKINQKLLRKLLEEQYLKPGKMIYLDLNSQKKPSYGVYKNWILTQDSDRK